MTHGSKAWSFLPSARRMIPPASREGKEWPPSSPPHATADSALDRSASSSATGRTGMEPRHVGFIEVEHRTVNMASMIARLIVIAADLVFLLALAGCSPDPSGMTLSFETGEKVCQLTGDTDWGTGSATSAQTKSKFGFAGTDLGYPVEHHSAEHRNGLALFFGDSRFDRSRVDAEHPESGPPDDVIGWVSTHTPPTNERCLDLTVEHKVEGADKSPVSPVVGPPSIKQGLFNVPSGGVSGEGLLYGFFWTDHCLDKHDRLTCPGSASLNKFGRGYLARSKDDGRTFVDPVAMPDGFVYSTAVDGEAAADLPSEQRIGTYVFGVPQYRESVPYLAYAPPGAIGDPAAWLFFAGRKPDGQPRWGTHAAWNGNTGGLPSLSPPGQPELFVADGKDRCVGEFSVTWNRGLRAWLLLYNCDTSEFGQVIVARVAPAPWGPWSRASIILDPNRDHSW